MQKKSNNNKLLNKFSGLEDQLLDDGLGYSIGKNEIAQINNTEAKTSNFLIILKDVILILYKKSIKLSSSFLSEVIFLLRETVKKIVVSIQTKKQTTELKMSKYVRALDTDFERSENASNQLEVIKRENILTLEKNLQKVFSLTNISTNFQVASDVDNFQSVLDDDLYWIQFIAKKLSETKLDQNIIGLKNISSINNKEIQYVFTFELKTKGLKWGMFFSKHITKVISIMLKDSCGIVKGVHCFNATLDRDIFKLTVDRPYSLNKKIEDSPMAKNEVRRSLTELDI